MSKNEDAWRVLFERHGILDEVAKNGKFIIDSSQINTLRESRLMTKFDHLSNLPEIFKGNRLSVLPVSRGSYAIGDFEAYFQQTYNKAIKPEAFEFPLNIESLRPGNIYSESAAINAAFISGMIDELVGEKVVPTVSGRMGTSAFKFCINRLGSEGCHHLEVINSQCEIDGGFEGDTTLVIVEAKNAITENFIIRQLYYPYRLWLDKTGKRVVPIFLSYSNDIFHFFVYEFTDPLNYNSIRLVGARRFVFAPDKIDLDDIQRLLDQSKLVKEPAEPFPQADKFERVIDLLGLLASGEVEASSITANYDFDPRQTGYYTSAGKYLGLIEGRRGVYSLSKLGAQVLRMEFKQKYLSIAKAILSHEAFNLVCHLYLEQASRPPRQDVVEIMKRCSLHQVKSDATYWRRAKTVVGWIEWIFSLQG